MINKSVVSKKIGKRLKKLRKKRGVSQEELAHLSGVYRTYISHIEVGRYNPSIYILYKIAHALKIPVEELLKEPNR